MNEEKEFESHNRKFIKQMNKDKEFSKLARKWLLQSLKYEYSYHFRWLGRPIIQYPQDIIAAQEIIWKVKPDLIIETGIARGGSLIFNASESFKCRAKQRSTFREILRRSEGSI